MNTKSSLFHKARTAAVADYEREFGTRVISQEHLVIARNAILGDCAEDSLAEAANVLACLAVLGVDPEAVLADIFFKMEFDPEAAADEAICAIIRSHLDGIDDALSVS